MGGGESKEEGAGVWEEMKKIDDKEALKKLLPKLYTLCKDLDRFMDAVSVKEIRDYFTAKREGFLFVVSSVRRPCKTALDTIVPPLAGHRRHPGAGT